MGMHLKYTAIDYVLKNGTHVIITQPDTSNLNVCVHCCVHFSVHVVLLIINCHSSVIQAGSRRMRLVKKRDLCVKLLLQIGVCGFLTSPPCFVPALIGLCRFIGLIKPNGTFPSTAVMTTAARLLGRLSCCFRRSVCLYICFVGL